MCAVARAAGSPAEVATSAPAPAPGADKGATVSRKLSSLKTRRRVLPKAVASLAPRPFLQPRSLSVRQAEALKRVSCPARCCKSEGCLSDLCVVLRGKVPRTCPRSGQLSGCATVLKQLKHFKTQFSTPPSRKPSDGACRRHRNGAQAQVAEGASCHVLGCVTPKSSAEYPLSAPF